MLTKISEVYQSTELQFFDDTLSDEDGSEYGSLKFIVHNDEEKLIGWLDSIDAEKEVYDKLDEIGKELYPIAILKNINIHEEKRNNGLGSGVFDFFLDKTRHVEYQILECDESEGADFNLESWYKELGFETIGMANGCPVMLRKNK